MGMGLVLVTFTGKGMEAGGKGRGKEAAGMILGYKEGWQMLQFGFLVR